MTLWPGTYGVTVGEHICISYAYDVRVDDTFVMVGGRFDSDEAPFNYDFYDTLIKYSPQSGTFTELPNRMKLARDSATAILVDRSIFPSCA